MKAKMGSEVYQCDTEGVLTKVGSNSSKINMVVFIARVKTTVQ